MDGIITQKERDVLIRDGHRRHEAGGTENRVRRKPRRSMRDERNLPCRNPPPGPTEVPNVVPVSENGPLGMNGRRDDRVPENGTVPSGTMGEC